MPLQKGKGHVSSNIRELHKGPQYQRTKKKFGKEKADDQAEAIALEQERKAKRRKKK